MTAYTDSQKQAIALMAICVISFAALIYIIMTNSGLYAAVTGLDGAAFIENLRSMTTVDLAVYTAALVGSFGTLLVLVSMYRKDVSALWSMEMTAARNTVESSGSPGTLAPVPNMGISGEGGFI